MLKRILTWKFFFLFLCSCLVILNLFVIEIFLLGSGTGDDFHIYCTAVETFEDGKNPYIVSELQEYSNTVFSFIYPPLTLPFFKSLCILDTIVGYFITWIFLLLITYLIVKKGDKNFDSLLLITLLSSGFLTTFWNFITGNIGLFELVLLAITFYCILKRQYNISALFLGLASFPKILPIFFAILFLFRKTNLSNKFKPLLIAIGTLLLTNLLSLILFPNITHSYYLSLIGKIDQQHSPIYETATQHNPSLLLLTREISQNIFGNSLPISIFLYFLGCTSIAFLFLLFIRKKKRKFLHTFSFGILAIMILLPRLKPYSFTLALLPVYYLIKNYSFRNKFLALFIISVCPLAIFLLRYTSSTNLLSNYNQLISLVILFALIFIKDSLEWKN